MATVTIKVKMKRGGSLFLEATGRCYTDTDGVGQTIQTIDDSEVYWPMKKHDKKRYPVRIDLIADWNQVEEVFWDAVTSNY